MKTAVLDDKILDRECSVFSIYLIGEPPSEYVKRKYREAHQTGLLLDAAAQPAEDFLVRVASIGPWSAKIIDAYTRIFRPFSTVRKKLVLLLAILESCAPSHARLDSADSMLDSCAVSTIGQSMLDFRLDSRAGDPPHPSRRVAIAWEGEALRFIAATQWITW